jgi:5-methylcytosine-specific restriction enzyme A
MTCQIRNWKLMMLNTEDLTLFLTELFGLPVDVNCQSTQKGEVLVIRPSQIPTTIGFAIEYLIGWRSIGATFIPDHFASELIQKMQDATPEQIATFKIFYSSMVNDSASVEMYVSGNVVDVTDVNWPERWETVQISMRRGPFYFDIQNAESIREDIYPWIKRFYALILSLLPLEMEERSIRSENEGTVLEATVKRYERSKINRVACIEINGVKCKVCDFNFSSRYGDIGEGFIHVHHITPLSAMGGSYVLDPTTDLIPVCPNCHAMLHKTSPPLLVEELKEILRD